MSTLAQRRTAAAAAIVMLIAVLQYVLLAVSPAGATNHVTVYPIDVTSNLTCSDLASDFGFDGTNEVKVDPPVEGTQPVPGGGQFTITNLTATSFDWTSTVGVAAVFVKTGQNASNLYVYSPEAFSDTGLSTRGGKAISHISFCFSDTPDTTTTTQGSTTTTQGSTTTTQASTTTTQGSTTTTQGSTTLTAAPLGALGDYVWVDSNPDCTQGATELPLAGVQVDLFDDGVFVASTFTDANGGYLFEGLPPSSTYQVRFTLTDTAEVDYSFTSCDATVPDDIDSDAVAQADTNVGVTSFINLPAGVTDRTWDAGVVFTNVQGIQIESTTTTIEPVTVGTLPFTGVDLEDLVWLATGVLAAGLAVLFQMGRRDIAAHRHTVSGWSNNK